MHYLSIFCFGSEVNKLYKKVVHAYIEPHFYETYVLSIGWLSRIFFWKIREQYIFIEQCLKILVDLLSLLTYIPQEILEPPTKYPS